MMRPFLTITLFAVWAVILLGIVGVNIVTAPHEYWYEQRLAPTVFLVHERRLYQGPHIEGPLVSCIYGPLSYLTYLPATVLTSRKALFHWASTLSFIYLTLPALLIYFRYRGQVQRYQLVACFIAFFTLLVFLSPIAYVGAFVSADAPAISFAALCALLLFPLSVSNRRLCWSGLFLVLSVGCKQNMAAIAIPILLLLGLQPQKRRMLAWWVVSALIWAAGFLMVVRLIYGDFGAIVFNDVVIPRAWPLERQRIANGARVLYRNCYSPLILAAGLLAIGYAGRPLHMALSARERFLQPAFLAACAVCLLPFSMLTFAAVGASDNSFAHLLYFLSLSILIFSLELFCASPDLPRLRYAIAFWQTTAAALMLISAAQVTLNPFSLRRGFGPSPADTAYSFSKHYPDEVYFPTYPVSTYYATGHFAHTEWGIMNRLFGGQPPSPEDVWQYAPSKAKVLAYARTDGGTRVLMQYLSPHRIQAYVDGLEEFDLYVIERPGT